MYDILLWIALILGAYLLGSVPFAFLLGMLKGVDVRTVGSGNVGASNLGRTLGRRWGILCFVMDVLKGTVPTVTCGLVMGYFTRGADDPALSVGEIFLWMGVGVAAVIGHMYSIFLKFGGGKGVATGFGVMAGIYPFLTWPSLAAMLVWVIVVKASRYISLASMVAAGTLPVWIVLMQIPLGGRGDMPEDDVIPSPTFMDNLASTWPYLAVTVAMAMQIIWKHRTNISRIRDGTEIKVGAPPTAAERGE